MFDTIMFDIGFGTVTLIVGYAIYKTFSFIIKCNNYENKIDRARRQCESECSAARRELLSVSDTINRLAHRIQALEAKGAKNAKIK